MEHSPVSFAAAIMLSPLAVVLAFVLMMGVVMYG